jgi:uncharacterized cupin superfamily protein
MKSPILNVMGAQHHHANEEHFFVLSGTGVLRIGAETSEVNTGVRFAFEKSAEARFLPQDRAKDAVGYWDGEDGGQIARIIAERSTR